MYKVCVMFLCLCMFVFLYVCVFVCFVFDGSVSVCVWRFTTHPLLGVRVCVRILLKMKHHLIHYWTVRPGLLGYWTCYEANE